MSTFWIFTSLALVNLLFGAGYPFVKSILFYLEPGQWLLIRAVFSTLILIVYTRKDLLDTSLSLRDLFWIILACLFGVLINQICFVEGLKRTIPAHAAMINATVPLLTLLLGAFFLRENLSARKIIGIGLGLFGILYLLGFGLALEINPLFRGDLLSFANAASYSIYLIIARYALNHLKPSVALTWITAFGIIGFGIYADWQFPIQKILTLPPKIWFYMLYLICVPSVIGYGIYLWALKRVEASSSALFSYLQPVSSGILAYLLLGDIPGNRFYVSAAFILSGIVIGNWRR